MSAFNPLSSRCTARAKSTGERCLRWVVGSGICHVHGRSRKVAAAQQARAAVMEAELEAAKKGQPYERRHPAAVLLDAVLGSDVLLRHLLDRRAAGDLTPEESTALGWAIDRASRVSKVALDASLDARLLEFEESRLNHAAEDIAAKTQGMWIATLRRLPLAPADKLLLLNGLYDTMAEILREQVEVPRALGPEVRGYAEELKQQVAARELEAAADPDEDLAWCGRCGEPIPGTDAPGLCEACRELEAAEDDDLELADVSILFPLSPVPA